MAGLASNTFGPNYSTSNEAYAIAGSDYSYSQQEAVDFVSHATGAVNRIDVSVPFNNYTPTDGVNISLWTEQNGYFGTELGQWFIPPTSGGLPFYETISGITGVDVTSGQRYLLLVAPATNATDAAWMFSTWATGTMIGCQTGCGQQSNWSSFTYWLPAYDVLTSTTPTPEPTSIALLASGLVGIFARRLRRSA